MRVGGDADEGLPLLVQRARGSETQRHSHQHQETSTIPKSDMQLATTKRAALCSRLTGIRRPNVHVSNAHLHSPGYIITTATLTEQRQSHNRGMLEWYTASKTSSASRSSRSCRRLRRPRSAHRHIHTTSPACYSYASGVPGRPHLSASRPLNLTLRRPQTWAFAHEQSTSCGEASAASGCS